MPKVIYKMCEVCGEYIEAKRGRRYCSTCAKKVAREKELVSRQIRQENLKLKRKRKKFQVGTMADLMIISKICKRLDITYGKFQTKPKEEQDRLIEEERAKNG